MSDQDAHAMIRLNHAVKVAEGASERRDYGSSPRKTEAQIAEDGFPRFKDLPPEIRSKIWQDAMPPYGIYTVLMLGRQEPMPQQPPPPAPVVFRTVYRLEPVPRDQHDDDLMTRLVTMRAIQAVSSEAAHEVERAFPTTIDCTGGKLRLNAMHDSLSLSDLQCILGSGFLQRFARYTQGAVAFVDNWHKIPRTMLFNNRTLWTPFSLLAHIPASLPGHLPHILRQMKGFLDFLADCTSLETVGVVYDAPEALIFNLIDVRSGEVMPFSLLTPVMRDPFYQRAWSTSIAASLWEFEDGFRGMRAVIKGLDPARGPWGVPGYLQSVTFRHPTLQDLKFLVVVPVSLALRDEVMEFIEEWGV